MNPAGGAGAQTAIQDAVALANWISTLQSPTQADLETIFKEYRAERYPIAKAAFSTSQMFKNIGGTVRSTSENRLTWWTSYTKPSLCFFLLRCLEYDFHIIEGVL